jgi:hypothetical protein
MSPGERAGERAGELLVALRLARVVRGDPRGPPDAGRPRVRPVLRGWTFARPLRSVHGGDRDRSASPHDALRAARRRTRLRLGFRHGCRCGVACGATTGRVRPLTSRGCRRPQRAHDAVRRSRHVRRDRAGDMMAPHFRRGVNARAEVAKQEGDRRFAGEPRRRRTFTASSASAARSARRDRGRARAPGGSSAARRCRRRGRIPLCAPTTSRRRPSFTPMLPLRRVPRRRPGP